MGVDDVSSTTLIAWYLWNQFRRAGCLSSRATKKRKETGDRCAKKCKVVLDD